MTISSYIHHVLEVNEPCFNVWYERNKVTWPVGFFKSKKDDANKLFEVEQLIHLDGESHPEWIHPPFPGKEIIDIMDADQVIRAENGKRFHVEGKWSPERVHKFVLKNLNDIPATFECFGVNFS